MGMPFILIGLAVFTAYLILNLYVGLRSYHALKAFWPLLPPLLFWPVFLVLASSFILDRFINIHSIFPGLIGNYWLAVFLYLLFFYFLIDLAGLLNRYFRILPGSWRKYWVNKKIYALGLVLAAAVILLGVWNARYIQFSSYELEIEKNLPQQDKLRIVMVADLHLDRYADFSNMERAAQRITSQNPDFIFLCGDIFENYLDYKIIEKKDLIFDALKSKYGTYAVLGNHEYYGGQSAEITSYLEQKGITVLVDQVAGVLDDKIYIAGRNDGGARQMGLSSRKPLKDILAGLDRTKTFFLLDHQPRDVEEAFEEGIDLMLSGHTHGGQLFPAQFFTKALFLIDRGHYNKDGFNLIVTTGLGTWGPPVKTSSKTEIVVIDIAFTGRALPSAK